MKNRWSEEAAKAFSGSDLDMRVYSSRLLGADPSLVLHGGGNTSVKISTKNFFGEIEDLLYVKGSGWDLASIEAPGFAPVRMKTLLKLAELPNLSDTDMVREQRAAMTDPNAPTPSVEAILHALIPHKFVDHTHADAIIAMSNSPAGPERLTEILGKRVLFVPYVMPGFVLAKKVRELTVGVDWTQLEGMVLLHHGIFSFGATAHESYTRMLELVTRVEQALATQGALSCVKRSQPPLRTIAQQDLLTLATLRKHASGLAQKPLLARWDSSPQALGFSEIPQIQDIATRGPLTPDHVIQTKRIPLILKSQPQEELEKYKQNYIEYFQKNASPHLKLLDPAPRWAAWPGRGTLALAPSFSQLKIISDIIEHTRDVIQWAEHLGGWQALSAKDIFEVEYWELEQAKLKKSSSAPEFQGRVALVTGAASGIGRACVENLRKKGAVVAALDISPRILEIFSDPGVLALQADLTRPEEITRALMNLIPHFGGLDFVVSNAGTFPPGQQLSQLEESLFEKTLQVNLSSHQFLLKQCVPFLELGLQPAIVIMGSKNVPAPGPGAAAYSAAKAGLTQLARVAALELAPKGIRVNVIHPNQVFDTGIWTEEILKNRAQHYGLTVEEYKRNNLLKVEVTSNDVAELVALLCGSGFSKITGAQIPIDGGNDRVI